MEKEDNMRTIKAPGCGCPGALLYIWRSVSKSFWHIVGNTESLGFRHSPLLLKILQFLLFPHLRIR